MFEKRQMIVNKTIAYDKYFAPNKEKFSHFIVFPEYIIPQKLQFASTKKDTKVSFFVDGMFENDTRHPTLKLASEKL
jgi:hypothetical protein